MKQKTLPKNATRRLPLTALPSPATVERRAALRRLAGEIYDGLLRGLATASGERPEMTKEL